MFGAIVLATVTIFGNLPSDLPAERLDSGYCETGMVWHSAHHQWEAKDAALPCTPNASVPTHCEDYVVREDGGLYCADDDEVFPAGHWAYDIGPDQGDLQVVVEY